MKRVAPGILMVLLLWLGLRCDNQAVGPPPHLTVQDLPPGSAGVRAVLSDIPSSAQVAARGAAVPAGAASVDVPLPAGTAGDLAAGVLAVDRAGCVLATGSRNFSLGRPVVALTSPPAYADTPGPPVNAQLQVPLAPLPAPDCRGGAVLLFAAGWTAGGAGAVLALRGAGFTRSTTV